MNRKKRKEMEAIVKSEKRWMDEDTGRVFSKGAMIGFGIREKGTTRVHMTHNRQGVALQDRLVVTVPIDAKPQK